MATFAPYPIGSNSHAKTSRAALGRLVLAAVLLAVSTAACGYQHQQESDWPSPNLLIDRARLDEIRVALAADDPVLTPAYRQLLADASSCLAQQPRPPDGPLRVPLYYKHTESQRAATLPLRQDAVAAYTLALAYALSGEPAYAAKAKEFLFAWVDHCTGPANGGDWDDWLTLQGRGDTALVIGYSFPNLIYAFDLLHGSGALDQAEITRFRTWLRPFVNYMLQEEWLKNNHHDWQSLFLLCAGQALEDETVFERGLRYYRRGIRVEIDRNGALPMELARGERAATYTLMTLEAMAQSVQIARNHGYPELLTLRSDTGGDLQNAFDFLLAFLQDSTAWQAYTGNRYLRLPDSPAAWGYLFELPYLWWNDPRYLEVIRWRPYGYANADRVYTLLYATLLFAQ